MHFQCNHSKPFLPLVNNERFQCSSNHRPGWFWWSLRMSESRHRKNVCSFFLFTFMYFICFLILSSFVYRVFNIFNITQSPAKLICLSSMFILKRFLRSCVIFNYNIFYNLFNTYILLWHSLSHICPMGHLEPNQTKAVNVTKINIIK